MSYLQGVSSYIRTDEDEEFNVGRVLVLKSPPAWWYPARPRVCNRTHSAKDLRAMRTMPVRTEAWQEGH
jgi:hypothetical protein